MSRLRIPPAVLVGIWCATWLAACAGVKRAPVISQSTTLAESVSAAAEVPQRPAPATDAVEEPRFRPGFDDLMTMLVQPRHIKLYYAGQQQNWELAAFQLRELRSSFRRASQVVDSYRGLSVDENVAAIMGPSLEAMDAAIAAGSTQQFSQAYAQITEACNACHAVMEYPFLVMRVPLGAGSVYPDQDFAPQP